MVWMLGCLVATVPNHKLSEELEGWVKTWSTAGKLIIREEESSWEGAFYRKLETTFIGNHCEMGISGC
jgi:hypothetical protein